MSAKAGLEQIIQLPDFNIIYFKRLGFIPALVPTNENPYKKRADRLSRFRSYSAPIIPNSRFRNASSDSFFRAPV